MAPQEPRTPPDRRQLIRSRREYGVRLRGFQQINLTVKLSQKIQNFGALVSTAKSKG